MKRTMHLVSAGRGIYLWKRLGEEEQSLAYSTPDTVLGAFTLVILESS